MNVVQLDGTPYITGLSKDEMNPQNALSTLKTLIQEVMSPKPIEPKEYKKVRDDSLSTLAKIKNLVRVGKVESWDGDIKIAEQLLETELASGIKRAKSLLRARVEESIQGLKGQGVEDGIDLPPENIKKKQYDLLKFVQRVIIPKAFWPANLIELHLAPTTSETEMKPKYSWEQPLSPEKKVKELRRIRFNCIYHYRGIQRLTPRLTELNQLSVDQQYIEKAKKDLEASFLKADQYLKAHLQKNCETYLPLTLPLIDFLSLDSSSVIK